MRSALLKQHQSQFVIVRLRQLRRQNFKNTTNLPVLDNLQDDCLISLLMVVFLEKE
jgi:hypothetical protein